MNVSKSEHSTWIQESDDYKFQLWGFKYNSFKRAVSWLMILLTGGLLRLVFHWWPSWHIQAMCNPCSLGQADVVLIRDVHMSYSMRPVLIRQPNSGASLPSGSGQFTPVSSYKCFTYKKLTYIWTPTVNKFCKIPSLDDKVPLTLFHNLAAVGGLSSGELSRRLSVFGLNVISVKLKPILVLLFRETLNPFYVFQILSVILWYNDDYIYYASVIVAMSVISISLDVYQTRKHEKALRDMVHSTDIVTVFRPDMEPTQISSDQLVPGDLIQVPAHGCLLQCDIVLLNGTCIVNESMLTGESVPVTKTPLPVDHSMEATVDDPNHLMMGQVYNAKEHAKHTLFSGTRVLQTRFYSGQSVKGLVIRTGYSTMKGQLVRSIMYPKPVDFQFTKDLLKFVGCLGVIAGCGFLYTIILKSMRGEPLKRIILRSLDIITIVVPPALPAAMTIGIMAAQMRLKKEKVFCISPSTINTCGAINAVCFDKTGTLTEDGLDFNCVVPVKPSPKPDQACEFVKEITSIREMSPNNDFVVGMAACHSLTRIDGEICGDPLDLILFDETGWSLEEPEVVEESGRFDMLAPTVVRPPTKSIGHSVDVDPQLEVGVLRQFTFSSSLQRMSVLVRKLGEPKLSLFCKGAPEMVASLCKSESLPRDFSHMLQLYAKKGYRVLALAHREVNLSFVKAQRVPRDQVECELSFLGLMVLENQLKPQTAPVIKQLHDAKIRTIMVTGDNLLTAMSVARECGLLPEERDLFIVEVALGSPVLPNSPLELVLKPADFNEEHLQNKNGHTRFNNMDIESNILDIFEMEYSLAMTGITYAALIKHYPELIDRIVTSCDVFARMSPDQKQQLVGDLQGLGYIVAMCGDGANDCGALKAAHAGISLSEAEASIASPFTSQIADIRCVPLVIRQGRAALVTSFGVFKYMAGYSITQFLTVLLMYWIGTNLSDFMFLFIDLFLITVFAIFFGYTDAADNLSPKPPPSRILSIQSVLSIIFQLSIVSAFQIFTFEYVTTQSWFTVYVPPEGDEDDFYSYQNTSVFWISVFQYITLAIVYSKSYPYRKTIFNNKLFFGSLVFCTVICIWFCLGAPNFIIDWLNLKQPEVMSFRALLLVCAAVNFILSFCCEMFIIDRWVGDKLDNKLIKHVPKYAQIMQAIGMNPDWIIHFIDKKCGSAVSSPGSAGTMTSGSVVSSADEDTNLLPLKRSNIAF